MRYSVLIVCCLCLASGQQERQRRRIKKKIIVQSDEPRLEEAGPEPPVAQKSDIELKPKEPRG